MRRLVIMLPMALAAGTPITAALADLLADCTGGAPSVKRMDACTALINDKSQPRATLAAAHYNRGTVYVDWAYAVPSAGASDFGRAAADFDEAISLDPRHAASYFERGRTRQGLRQFNPAIADSRKAWELDPKRRAWYYYMEGQVAEARPFDIRREGARRAAVVNAYSDAIAAEPGYAAPYLARGIAYESDSDQIDPAIADFSMVISLYPHSVAAYVRRGRAYRVKADAHGRRGSANFAFGNYELAIADYSRAIEITRPNAELHFGRGSSHEGAGRRDDAIADYRKALALGPSEDLNRIIRKALERLGAAP